MCGQKYCFGCGSCVDSDWGPTQVPLFAVLIIQRGHKTVSGLHCLVMLGREEIRPVRLLLALAIWLGTSC